MPGTSGAVSITAYSEPESGGAASSVERPTLAVTATGSPAGRAAGASGSGAGSGAGMTGSATTAASSARNASVSARLFFSSKIVSNAYLAELRAAISSGVSVRTLVAYSRACTSSASRSLDERDFKSGSVNMADSAPDGNLRSLTPGGPRPNPRYSPGR